MRFKEIVRQLTGLSFPVFGVSWNPSEAEVTVARRVLTFLEDRQVLRYQQVRSDAGPCAASAREIRSYLTDELLKLKTDSELHASLTAMRRANKKFLAELQEKGVPEDMNYNLNSEQSADFQAALGRMRNVFAYHLTRLAVQHGLDLRDEIAWMVSSLPERTV
jgi:hypothetical protein